MCEVCCYGHLKSVLVSLVRSYGVKAQKSLAEVAADIRIAEKDCEIALETLIDLRLVRHVADLYEIAHDFLAQEVSARLVDSEEREFKRIRELLISKSATFSTTGSILTVEELLMLFNYWFQIEMGEVVGKRMAELGEPIPAELLRISRRNDFWKDPRALNSKAARKSSGPLQSLYNRALYTRLVAHALIGSSGQADIDRLRYLCLHEFRMIARAAAIRLTQLGGDSGIILLQAAVTDAIERQHAEAFGLAVREAEIEKFGLLNFDKNEAVHVVTSA